VIYRVYCVRVSLFTCLPVYLCTCFPTCIPAYLKESAMGELLGFLDAIVDIGDLYERYGIKGCLLILLAIVALFGVIILIALQLQ
jgi:hypothetical protein